MADSNATQREPAFPGLIWLVLSVIGICAATAGFALGVWLVATLVLGSDASSNAFGLLASYDTKNLHAAPAPAQQLFFFLGIIVFLCLILATWMAAMLRGRGQWRRVLALQSLQRTPATSWLIIFFIAAPLYLVAASFLIRFVDPTFRTWFFVPGDPLGLVLSFLLVVVLAPIAEELLFRGFVYSWLEKMFRKSTAVIATAVFFALAHTDGGIIYPLAILLPGIALTFARAWTGSTWASMAVHACYNAWAWVLVLVLGRDLV